MPRTKPTTRLGVYGKFDINPENAVELYNESKAQNKFFIDEPSWDVARDGIEAYAIQTERQHTEMLADQDELREQVKSDAIKNEKRLDEMFKIDEKLREKFISVNEFLRECEEKEQIAIDKINSEKIIQHDLKKEIDKIELDIEILLEFLTKLNSSVNEFQPYEEILEQVVSESPLFKSVNDLMSRCDALMLAQVEIAEMEQTKIKAIEEMREKLVESTNSATLTVMGMNNELAELERCYTESKRECMKWGKVLTTTKDVIAEKESITFQLLDQIQQLYGLCCKRAGSDIIYAREEVEQQLDFIKGEIEFYKDLIQFSKKMISDEKKSDIAQKGSEKH